MKGFFQRRPYREQEWFAYEDRERRLYVDAFLDFEYYSQEGDEIVFVQSAKCLECGHEFSATEFWNDGRQHEYPVPATVQFCRSELVHPALYGGCGGRVALSQT